MNRRHHDIDALRVIAFALLILYHVAMVYVFDWGYHVKSDHQWSWLQWPMVALNRWRMPLLFLLSGIALGLSASARNAGRMARRRTRTLLIPLVFGMLAIVPVQAWVEARVLGDFAGGFGAFLWRYWQFRPWPDAGFSGAEFGITWNHLWYLAYLWVYTLVLAVPVALRVWMDRQPWARRIRSKPPGKPAGSRRTVLQLAPVAWWFVCLYWLEPWFGDTKALFDDWANHALYFPVFVFGFWLARSPAAWQAVISARRASLGLAAAGLSVYMGLRVAGQVLPPDEVAALPRINWRAISDTAHALYAWSALLAIIGYAKAWLDRPFRWLPYANRAVYPYYILHQSLLVPLAWWLLPLDLPGPLEVLAVFLGTVAGCAVLHHFVILKTPLLWPLFGVSAVPARTRAG